jgi:hypothetical protein
MNQSIAVTKHQKRGVGGSGPKIILQPGDRSKDSPPELSLITGAGYESANPVVRLGIAAKASRANHQNCRTMECRTKANFDWGRNPIGSAYPDRATSVWISAKNKRKLPVGEL